MRFPIFSGESLVGEEITFPEVFSTEYVLVLVVFDRGQQERANPSLPEVAELLVTYPTLSFYDIPIFPASVPPPARLIAQAGLRAMMDEQWHETYVMVFLENRETFTTAMDIPNLDNPQLFVVTIDGKVVWRVEGDLDEVKIAALREQLAQLFGE